MEAENILAWSLLAYSGVQVSLKLAHRYKLSTGPNINSCIMPASAAVRQNLGLRLCAQQGRQMPCSPLKR